MAQLLVATASMNGYQRGDIIAVMPDTHVWGKAETLASWVAAGETAGSFINPGFAAVQLATDPVDLNLADPMLMDDPVDGIKHHPTNKRAWFVDIDSLPGNVKRDFDDPGAVVVLPSNRWSAVKRRADGVSKPGRIPDASQQRTRLSGTSERERLGG